MLWVARDAQGRLEACAEVCAVNAQGQRDPGGAYVWVEQFELSRGCEATQVMRRLTAVCAHLFPAAQYAYWMRRDKTHQRPHRPISRAVLSRFAQKQYAGEQEVSA